MGLARRGAAGMAGRSKTGGSTFARTTYRNNGTWETAARQVRTMQSGVRGTARRGRQAGVLLRH